jgi:membrane-associated protein
MAQDFYSRHGGLALVAGRFLPIIRTFAPILAGVIKMDLKKFTFYNVVGSILWVFSLILLGFFLGQKFPVIKDYLEYIIIGLIVVTAIPVIKSYRAEKQRMAKT